MNIFDYKKTDLSMNDFIYHLKGLVARCGEEIALLESQCKHGSPFGNQSPYLELSDFLDIDKFTEENVYDHYSNSWSEKQKEEEPII